MVQTGVTQTVTEVQETPKTPENQTRASILEPSVYKTANTMSDAELLDFHIRRIAMGEEDIESSFESEYMEWDMMSRPVAELQYEVLVQDTDGVFIICTRNPVSITSCIESYSTRKPPQIGMTHHQDIGACEIFFMDGVHITCPNKKSFDEVMDLCKNQTAWRQPEDSAKNSANGQGVSYTNPTETKHPQYSEQPDSVANVELLTDGHADNIDLIKTVLIAYFTFEKEQIEILKQTMSRVRKHVIPRCSDWAEVEQQVANAAMNILQNMLSTRAPVLKAKFIPDVMAYRKNLQEYRRKSSMGNSSF